MLSNLRRSEKKILNRPRQPEDCCGSELENARRLLVGARGAKVDVNDKKRCAFAALHELELFGKSQVTKESESLVRQCLEVLLDSSAYQYAHDLRMALKSAVTTMTPGDKYVPATFASLFANAAQYELEQQRYSLAKDLALYSLRIEYAREENTYKTYEALLVLSAVYGRVKDTRRALEVWQEAVATAKDQSWASFTQDPVGNRFFIPAFEGAAIEYIREGNLINARKLTEAARDQAGMRDHGYAGYRRLSAMLAKICIEQNDYPNALQCMKDIDCATGLDANSSHDDIRLGVNIFAKPLGVAWP